MKNLFLTAIALVAFTGTSMANTIEDKKIDEKCNNVTTDSCIDWAIVQMENADPNNEATSEELHDCYHAYYDLCHAIRSIFGIN